MPRRVYITEKPSVAKDLANVLGLERTERHPKDGRCGYHVVKGGDWVVWQIGHMRELVDLEHYLPESLRGPWSAEQLKQIPDRFLTEPKAETEVDKNGRRKAKRDKNGSPIPSPQYGILLDLIRKADIVVNAGDIDKEGQLVADEILEAAGVDPAGSAKPIERVMLNALDPENIRRALANRRANGEPQFVNLRMAATARRDADWLVGIFGTRAMSIRAQTAMPVSVGRVMTAVLSLVERREREIEAFKPKTFYVPVVRLPDGLVLEWKGRADGKPVDGMDHDGRIIDKTLADSIVARIRAGLAGAITKVDGLQKKVAPPLPHSIGQLQTEMGAREGIPPDRTMAAAQSLYEKHKAISYVGTDCRYLPEAMHADGRAVIGGLAGQFMNMCQSANPAIKSAAYDDSKIEAHHGIVPTGVLPAGLSEDEKKVFLAVVKRYLAQYHPAYEYRACVIEAAFGGDSFAARWQETMRPGWQAVDPEPSYLAQLAQGSAPKSALDETDEAEEESAEAQHERSERKARDAMADAPQSGARQ